MSEISIWSTMRAKPGREADAERFLFETLNLIHRETGTTRFFLLKLANSSFAIFDTFVGTHAFQAHLDGPVPKFVAHHAAELFEDPPTITRGEVLGIKDITTLRTGATPMIEMKAYGRYDLQVKLFDGGMNLVEAFPIRQDLWISPDTFVIRLTRDRNGEKVGYEDRGVVDAHGKIGGLSGYGGQLEGQLMQNASVFLNGTEGAASFIMIATQTAPDHYRCFRRLEVTQPAKVFGTDVKPGLYFVTTEDQLVESADQPPADLRSPLQN